MLRSRIIPCLLVSNNGLVKTIKFKNPKYVGDPINAVRIFNEKETDELMILDIDATKFNKEPDKVSILAYDALGLIYYCWFSNNFNFKKEHLFNKKGFKGLHGKFLIEENISKQKLKIYKVYKKKFVKVY